MSLDPADLRRVLGHFTTGVTVVATLDAERRPAGLTANAFASVSLDPPLVLVCVDRGSDTHGLIARSRVFTVNVLAREQVEIARRFAGEDREHRFEGLNWRAGDTGAPRIDDALAWFDCSLHASVPGGDHTIYVGSVVAAGARAGEPLLFFRGAYR